MNDLTSAIKTNDIAAVKSLLADGSVDVNARIAEMRNSPLLVFAADHGRVEIVALLLDAGARIDNVNDLGESACHAAARNNHVDVVELLVARNANFALRNGNNVTPIFMAIDRKNERLVMLLIDAAIAAGITLDDETLCRAATVSADVIRLLLVEHRINLSAVRGGNGCTPLHQAVLRQSDASVLNLLVEVAGVDIDARDVRGRTAALFACSISKAGMLSRLIAGGANLDLADDSGQTPLHICAINSTDDCATVVLAAGANVHARNVAGRTACHYACELSRASLPALLAFGAKLDALDNNGVTPRQLLNAAPPTTEEIEAARGRVVSAQLSFVRERALEVCVGLQSIGLDALCTCEILLHACGPVAPLIAFHRWWQITTTIKHFRD